MTSHNTYYPTKEILGFIEEQNPNQSKDGKSNIKLNLENHESLGTRRWFSGRKNFP
ncbi:MAG: hypothetical protein PVH93_02195 [Nitrosopumilaceae archaeon]|jgi:hypothetical protein